MNINIRGISSMNENQPLLVVDGLISDWGAFNKINPSDIESVSILKDAGTAAIYGSRSGNGVILVTTKKGYRNQTPTVSITTSVGWQDPQQLFKPVKGYQNATLYNHYLVSSGKEAFFTADEIRDLYETGDKKWGIYELTQTALQQNYNVSVSGGGQYSTYMISAGYTGQQSNYIGNYGINRYNFRTNLTAEYGRFKVTGLMSYVRNNDRSTVGSSIEVNATRMPPYYFLKMKDEETGKYLLNNIVTDFNGMGQLEAGGYNKYRNDYVNINTGLEFKVIEGLKLLWVFGADGFNDYRDTWLHPVEYYSYYDTDILVNTDNQDRPRENWSKKAYLLNSQIMADYNQSFGKHNVSVLFGASNESYTSYEHKIKILYADNELGNQGDGSQLDTGSGVAPDWTTRTSINSLFGRVGYAWADKYFFDASFRYDGSSKFGKDHRWGFFPSVSLAWRLTEESFLESYREKVGELKFRTSYGVLGNQGVGSYKYFTTYDVYQNTYGWNNSSVPGAGFTLGAENLTWEKVHTFNVGVDATFVGNRLAFQADYYFRNTTDILVKPTIPMIYGTELSDHNAGEMRSQGWELNITYNHRHGDWRHIINFNMGDAWNKVTRYDGFQNLSSNGAVTTIMREGLPYNSYYGYKVAGIFQSYDEINN
ncbi:MAG: SusC/RagA family TonB-linked outer membrane protein, partial [Alistipes sp.]|nr:SusC/RagA family TonB-linked outer membrane protein [Alistipes sp.]